MEIYFAIFLYFILPTNGGASFIYDDVKSRGKIVDAIFPSFNGMTFAGVNVTLCVYDNSCDGFLLCIEREPNTRTNRVNQTSKFFYCPNLEQYSAIYVKTKYTSKWFKKDKMAVELYMPSLKNEQGQITPDIPLKFDLYEKLNYKITNEYEGYCVYFTLKDGDGGNVIKKAYNGEDLVKFDHDEALRISYSSSNTGRAISIKYFPPANCGLRLSVSSSNEPICQTFNSHQYQCPKGKIDEKIHLCKNKLETTGEYKLQMKDKRGIWSPEEIVPDIPNYISSAMAQTLLERLGKNHRNVYNDAMGSLGFPRNRELFLVEFRHFAHQMTVTQIDVECVVLFKYRYTVNTGVLYIEAGDFNDYFFIA